MIFEEDANLKYNYGNRHFWAQGYYVSTVRRPPVVCPYRAKEKLPVLRVVFY